VKLLKCLNTCLELSRLIVFLVSATGRWQQIVYLLRNSITFAFSTC